MDNALAEAAFKGDIDVLMRLLEGGADIDAAGVNFNPLHAAIEGGHVAIVRLLVSRGADIESPHDTLSPLAHAVDSSIDSVAQASGRPGDEPTDIIDVLLEAGADRAAALRLASRYGSAKLVERLRRGPAARPDTEMDEKTRERWSAVVAHYDSRARAPECHHLSRFRDFVAELGAAREVSGLTAVTSHDTLLLSRYSNFPEWFERPNLRVVPLRDGRVQINWHVEDVDVNGGGTWTVPLEEARSTILRVLPNL